MIFLKAFLFICNFYSLLQALLIFCKPIMHQKFNNLESASQALLSMQQQRRKTEGYPVCGLLLDQQGTVIHADTNGVLGKLDCGQFHVLDATNHAQQRMIYWYWANKAHLNLPQPSKTTIITTLDPCIMCTSSIILSGFNIGTITQDDFAGANYNRNEFKDYDFAPEIQKTLLKKFGYYKVNGAQNREKYQYSADNVYFKEESISKEVEKRIADHFFHTVKDIQKRYFIDWDKDVQQLKDLKQLQEGDELVKALKKADASALTIRLTEKLITNHGQTPFYQPSKELKIHLTKLLTETPNAKNAVALIDTHGNLLLSRADRFDISPVHSSIVNTVIDYNKLCFQLANTASKEGLHSKDSKISSFLPTLYNCSFVFLNALRGDDPISLQSVGVYNFALNRTCRKGGFVYINDYQKGDVTLEEAILRLPPMYGTVFTNIHPVLASIGRTI